MVFCNDPSRRQFALTVTGMVDKFVTVEPTGARLFGKTGEEIHATIRIVQEEKYPFRIEGPSRRKTPNIQYTLSRLDEPEIRGYLLTVENIREQTGRYFERIVLKTDSTRLPEIKISVHGYITE